MNFKNRLYLTKAAACIGLGWACMVGSCLAQATPMQGGSVDEMASFLADRGLVAERERSAVLDRGLVAERSLVERSFAERSFVERIGEQVSQAGRAVSNTASDLVVNAMGFLGVPYKRGGNSAESGFDCSGFVKAMYEQTIGLVLPRRAAEQAAATQSIDKSDLQPGDLVFFNTLKSAFSHVGIYVGDNKFIHSPRTGSVVRVEDMRVGYWSSRFDGARRVQPAQAGQAGQNR
jgi:NlpC/P60 family